jgi:hypothetical protein
MKGTIAIAASFAQKPLQGGHSWVLLQYLLGFKKLGWEVLLIDVLTADMCFDAAGKPCSLEHSVNLAALRNVMSRFGLEDDYVLLFNQDKSCIGQSREQVLERVGRSAMLLNVMGFLSDEEIIGRASKHVFLDIDPGFGQMWESLGLARIFDGYDDYVTIGENIGQPECNIPSCGKPWITTPQPVVLDYWPARIGQHHHGMTSVVSWRGAYGPVTFRGKVYGLRAHEFRKFWTLPKRTGQKFQLALSIHPNDSADSDILRGNGWSIVDPVKIAGDPWAYQSFIQESESEIMIAKNLYVDTRSGWFSDRSICYLASGKPVLAQDTGLKSIYPVGEGLILFSTLEEAIDGVAQLQRDYSRHARAAREIAETYFESDKVLGNLLRKLGIG